MAARFVVAVALFAVCHSSPVLINGEESRDGRSYSIGQGYSAGYGANQASANANGGAAQATSSNSDGGAYFRDAYGNVYPSESLAKAETYNGQEYVPYGAAKAQALANNGPYYPVPVEPAVITYNVPEVPVPITYEVIPQGPVSAQSVATSNGISDTSLSTATTNGAGAAESIAQTKGGAGTFGVTNTNAKTFGGPGSAASKANTGYGIASSNAQSQGHGYAASNAATNGANAIITPVVNEELAPAVIAAKYHGFRNVYAPPAYGSASSIANTNGQYGSAASSAKTGPVPQRRSIHWHFGTAYDIPAGYAKSAANTHGYGSANANSNVNSGLGIAKTTANTQGQGYANANANINNPSYAYIRSEPVVEIGYGAAQTHANTQGYGIAGANAGQGQANSEAKSHGYGSANANANLNNSKWGVARIQPGTPWGGKSITNARTSGNGYANSSARDGSTGYRVVNSNANSAGYGAAQSDATSY